MSDFIVRFDGMKLSHEQTRHLHAAIGAAVETAMTSAAFTPNPEGGGGGGDGGESGHVVSWTRRRPRACRPARPPA